MWNLITLDGYFEGEKPWDLDFHQLVWGDELQRFTNEQLDTADAIIFGEKTYQGMAAYWSNEKDEKAQRMTAFKKYVCSQTIEKADWNNTTIIRDAVAEIPKLKSEDGAGDLFVFGSGELSDSLIKAGLFDEYRICLVPVFLGKGRRLFADGLPNTALSLLKTKTLDTGGIILFYGRKA